MRFRQLLLCGVVRRHRLPIAVSMRTHLLTEGQRDVLFSFTYLFEAETARILPRQCLKLSQNLWVDLRHIGDMPMNIPTTFDRLLVLGELTTTAQRSAAADLAIFGLMTNKVATPLAS